MSQAIFQWTIACVPTRLRSFDLPRYHAVYFVESLIMLYHVLWPKKLYSTSEMKDNLKRSIYGCLQVIMDPNDHQDDKVMMIRRR